MITHLEPDIMECEVKCALGSITTNKARGGDECQLGCSESAALNMPANLENSAVATGLKNISFSFQSQRKAMSKNVQITTLTSHASKVMFKILQARLQQYMN